MQETVYPSLAASFEYYHRTGNPPPRTGNRQAGLSTAPYNVYPCDDGHVAIHIVSEGHWKNLTVAMGREDLQSDPRFVTNADRIAHMDEIDAVVSEWTRTLGRMAIFAHAKAHRIPCAPVRTAPEIMHDPHMHERGMLEHIDHPELGAVVLPNSPLRLHGLPKPPSRPSPKIGEHNAQIYGAWLGLSEPELAALKADGVI
jgi:crotonobetainyl-CoA:carnitine CoA-transferase CaiB-like acyl-CoA transferase